jgi:hypothetical protein
MKKLIKMETNISVKYKEGQIITGLNGLVQK